MKLSADFTLEDLTVTETGLSNAPGPQETEKLLYLALYILQPIQNHWGRLIVTSAFRSPQVNEAVGGVRTSQHLEGEAADFVTEEASLDAVFNWIRLNLNFGQVILEEKGRSRWIHVSLPRLRNINMQALIFKDGEYQNAPEAVTA